MGKTNRQKRHKTSQQSEERTENDASAKPPLRLAVFDLDYTIWQPEMYQLYGEPTLKPIDNKYNKRLSAQVLKEARTTKAGYILTDRRNSPMRVFGGAAVALSEIERLKAAGVDIQAAVASKTDAPSWARICMDHLVIDNDCTTTLISCFDNGHLVEISYGSKRQHLTRLHKKTGIPFEQMAFFDNESGNIRSVSALGVKCFYTPRGMQIQDWNKAKECFELLPAPTNTTTTLDEKESS
ncbi:Magnesium-dependent phosphatase 1 [Seminavis robusta]|uniref:Magnesium-dependent phosphatase 1 n=1 Tax=Seminavis robusta TaxID=568900 RepID=A0A9N8EU74_9STRA|nr:Magnesium-dependent phosphatase 1 [Seminavis robusta]|eukprot:Sro1831_g300380.1 Magnesium-dependent phosphatase 1 (239) ;mRNA; r:14284-15251